MVYSSSRVVNDLAPAERFCISDAEQIPDAVLLTSWEKDRLAELETVVEGGLQKFLEVGAALAEIRNRRLSSGVRQLRSLC